MTAALYRAALLRLDERAPRFAEPEDVERFRGLPDHLIIYAAERGSPPAIVVLLERAGQGAIA